MIIEVLEISIEKFRAIKIFSSDIPFYSHAIAFCVIKPLWTPNKNKVTIQIIAGMLLLMAHSTHECDRKKRRVSECTRWGGLDQGYTWHWFSFNIISHTFRCIVPNWYIMCVIGILSINSHIALWATLSQPKMCLLCRNDTFIKNRIFFVFNDLAYIPNVILDFFLSNKHRCKM